MLDDAACQCFIQADAGAFATISNRLAMAAYHVEALLDRRVEGGVEMFLVKWQHSWVPATSLGEDFEVLKRELRSHAIDILIGADGVGEGNGLREGARIQQSNIAQEQPATTVASQLVEGHATTAASHTHQPNNEKDQPVAMAGIQTLLPLPPPRLQPPKRDPNVHLMLFRDPWDPTTVWTSDEVNEKFASTLRWLASSGAFWYRDIRRDRSSGITQVSFSNAKRAGGNVQLLTSQRMRINPGTSANVKINISDAVLREEVRQSLLCSKWFVDVCIAKPEQRNTEPPRKAQRTD